MNSPRRQLVVRRNVISKYVDTPKSGHGRVLDLSAEVAGALERLREVTPSTAGRVFLQDSGRPALARHLYAWGGAAMAKAGIPKKKGAKLHVMRHSACSALAAMGAPTIAIQALAGHESPADDAEVRAPGARRSGRRGPPVRLRPVARAWQRLTRRP